MSNSEINLFEIAARKQYRFPSSAGPLTAEQLWTLPTISKTGVNLNSIAQGISKGIRESGEEVFVNRRSDPKNADEVNKLEIVKYVINTLEQEAETRENAKAKSEERKKLLAILEKKQDAALEELTPDQIEAKLKALGV